VKAAVVAPFGKGYAGVPVKWNMAFASTFEDAFRQKNSGNAQAAAIDVFTQGLALSVFDVANNKYIMSVNGASEYDAYATMMNSMLKVDDRKAFANKSGSEVDWAGWELKIGFGVEANEAIIKAAGSAGMAIPVASYIISDRALYGQSLPKWREDVRK